MKETLVLNMVEYCPKNKIITYTGNDQCFAMDLKGTRVSIKYNYIRPKDRKPKHIIGNLYLINGKYIIEAYDEYRTGHFSCDIARAHFG
jgi:hypothetical protein